MADAPSISDGCSAKYTESIVSSFSENYFIVVESPGADELAGDPDSTQGS